jgi:EF hand domain-containing protein
MRASRKSRIRNERNAFFALLGFSIAALVMPLPYMTVTASPKATPVFELVDRNRDGYIDRKEAEVVPGLVASFDKMDRNADGRLDRVEFARW